LSLLGWLNWSRGARYHRYAATTKVVYQHRFGLLLPSDQCCIQSPPPGSEAQPRDFTQGWDLATQAVGHSPAYFTDPIGNKNYGILRKDKCPTTLVLYPIVSNMMKKSGSGIAHWFALN
jgi:hypothetical protein